MLTNPSSLVLRGSESPHYVTKLKKLESLPTQSQSMSPPPITNETKKKKSNNARAQHPLGAESSKQGKQHSKQKNHHQQPKEELDFVRVKPKDQVPIATFWAALEPYFRNLSEEDRAYLLEKADNSKPYLIPPLGNYYAEQWAEEDRALGFGSHSRAPSRQNSVDHPHPKLKYLQHDLTDENLLQDDIGSGSLTERLLSSLVAEDLLDPSEATVNQSDDEEQTTDTDTTVPKQSSHHGRTIVELSSDPTDEIVTFEERLRRELRYAGLFADDDVSFSYHNIFILILMLSLRLIGMQKKTMRCVLN